MGLTLTKDTYRLDEVARLLGLHIASVRRYLLNGKLTATGTGTHRRVNRESIESLLRG